MLDKLVHDVQIKNGFEFDARGNAVAYQQYSYFIGTHGPFVQKFYAGEQYPDHVAKAINDQVSQLRTLGVVT